ncbi:cation-transporting P-type ATPase [bacterium]|nr:cation-transporting P-type ATPase [bacterium]
MKYKGLTPAAVAARRKKYGANIVPGPIPKSAWYFLAQVFQDKINRILLIMMLAFMGLAIAGFGDFYEAIGIGIVLLIISGVSVLTQLRAQRDALRLQLAAGQKFCRVIRSGGMVNIDSTEIVVGDIIDLNTGEIICADGYLIDGAVSVNNAILNGESEECPKKPVPGYKYNRSYKVTADDYTNANSLFAGTTVMGGAGLMMVTRVGMDTQSAEILATLHSIDDVQTSLQIQIDSIADKIGRIGALCGVLVFVVLTVVQYFGGTLGAGWGALRTLLMNVTVALTVFVAAVPEGLPFIISIITGRNTARMIRNHILPTHPAKIPAAGNLHIICTDKTGTLTHGIMSVAENYMGNGADVTGYAAEMFALNAVLNTASTYDVAGVAVGGNSTDRALLSAVSVDQAASIINGAHILRRVPFDSARKYSMTVARIGASASPITLVSGAPEVILSHCTKYIDTAGRVRKIDRSRIDRILHMHGARAMRIVATAYYDGAANGDAIPDRMVLTSVTAMRDGVRPDVSTVIETLTRAGIQTIMITGDIVDTARAIAAECGILTAADDIVITAAALDGHTDGWLRRNLHRIRVIARATPATKLRIVTVAQSLNKSIGMCGDGTNDAPALRRADVGFAMGDGTDVSKQAADIIITDNNFVSVARTVLIGRTFLHNIISFLKFQLPINFALVALCILCPILFGMDAMSAVQILIINIVMDSMNSLSFGGEAPRPEYMREPAPHKGAPLLNAGALVQIAVTTVMFLCIFAIILAPSVRALFDGDDAYMGARFSLLVIMAMFNGFNIRTDGYNIFSGLRENMAFIYVSIFVIVGCVLCVTFGGAALHVSPLDPLQWAVIFGLAFLIIPLDMLRKFICRNILQRCR